MKKKLLIEINAKLDLLLQHNNIEFKSSLNVGGTIPPDDDEEDGAGG